MQARESAGFSLFRDPKSGSPRKVNNLIDFTMFSWR